MKVVGESPWGLKNYQAVMKLVEPKPGQSALIWRSSFLKHDDSGEADVVERVQAGYESGLDNIKRIAESG